MPVINTKPGDVGGYSPAALKLAQVLGGLYGLTPFESMDLAKLMLDQSTIQHQTPPAPTPISPAQVGPQHLEDANLSAWQQYSKLIEQEPGPPKDAAEGQVSGRRSPAKGTNRQLGEKNAR